MKREPKLLGYYNYTVILTYIGMLTGFIGILAAFESNMIRALTCLMTAGVCDMFDGAIAATRERTPQERCFGIQIDSLSDLICFGVLPAVIVYRLNTPGLLAEATCALYVLCALIRLAWFNVDEQERQTRESAPRSVYYGMPVTLSALLVPLVYAVSRLLNAGADALMLSELLVMGALFLLPFPLKKYHFFSRFRTLFCGIAQVVLVALSFRGR